LRRLAVPRRRSTKHLRYIKYSTSEEKSEAPSGAGRSRSATFLLQRGPRVAGIRFHRLRLRFGGFSYTRRVARGWFITFEGGEGTGKSTQVERLVRHLEQRGLEVLSTREPGGTPLAEALRALMLDPRHRPDGLVELLLVEAARRDHVERLIRPALDRGAVVLCDRFTDSSLVYQGRARGLDERLVEELNRVATGGLVPDLTVIFDLEPAVALARTRSRGSASGGQVSRIDLEPEEFHERVREGFLELAAREPHRVRVVAAEGSPDEVWTRTLAVLPKVLR
jgi:dTMP kinase